ncbi:AgmX/PglI C-terminal domain-containing protein [Persicimonas caeni]|uniref:AgmX/PglI C-terminal domain-containing protein n=1 Tax=Persicimonas caeni TaxID=2292766 RepID=A0A4Y6PMT2_PERCE|nr:AgmX/PglI C-terminal domain-containing protein [Persicimonas caeni]QDG49523.1 AgmX/PglI C-terminal domain-containing protein [Persicimonas caeni]QED30744.1 AgmX/PglI C-terminal domain-containing protein [Persicimonas caeni]
MHPQSHSLRVVIVWRSTILEERTFSQMSSPVVRVGQGDKNDFSVLAPGLPDVFEMFERAPDGYTVRFSDRIAGVMQVDDHDWDIDELVAQDRAWPTGKARTDKGAAQIYEMKLATGDWGRLRLGDVHLFFQVIEGREAVAGRGWASVEMPLVAMVAFAALLHGAVLLTAFLTYEPSAELDGLKAIGGFAEVHVHDVPDPLDEDKLEPPSEETSGKKAGGEEGTFGEPDKVVDSKVPKDDGEMVDEVDPSEVGVNKLLSEARLGQGAIAKLMDTSDGISSKADVAFGGGDDELRVGRGTSGLSIRGVKSGGGGEGQGRIHGLGHIDTGGGPGSGGPSTGAHLDRKEAREVKAHLEKRTPQVGDFCDRGDIRKVVGAKASAIKYCFERQLQRQPDLHGKIIAQWKIGLDGKVMSASIASSTMNSRPVESCIEREISRLRFERPDGGICVINYPFVFTGVQ